MNALDFITAIATALGALGSAAAAIAALRGLNDSKRFQLMQTRPILVFERDGPRQGEYWQRQGDQQYLTAATYGFRMKNHGLGPAIMGNGPFRTVDSLEVTLATLQGRVVQGPFVQILDNISHLPNVISPGTDNPVRIATGNLDNSAMDNPWTFVVEYSDVHGLPFLTKVSIDPLTGNVVKLEHMENAPISWWKKVKVEFREEVKRP